MIPCIGPRVPETPKHCIPGYTRPQMLRGSRSLLYSRPAGSPCVSLRGVFLTTRGHSAPTSSGLMAPGNSGPQDRSQAVTDGNWLLPLSSFSPWAREPGGMLSAFPGIASGMELQSPTEGTSLLMPRLSLLFLSFPLSRLPGFPGTASKPVTFTRIFVSRSAFGKAE